MLTISELVQEDLKGDVFSGIGKEVLQFDVLVFALSSVIVATQETYSDIRSICIELFDSRVQLFLDRGILS